MVDFYSDETLDLWKTTLSAFPWKNKLAIFNKYHDYPISNRIMREEKLMVKGGTRAEWQGMIDDSGNATFITPMTELEYNASDVWASFHADWKLLHSYHMVTDDEVNANSSEAARLQHLLNGKRAEAASGIANQLEERTFATPSASDTLTPYGIPYACVPITSAQVAAGTSGFQGQNPVGFSDCYGVDTSTAKYARYRNYNDVWSNANADITETDVDKILEMLRKLKWNPPVTAQQFLAEPVQKLVMFTGNDMIKGLERKARANNDSLGADLGKFAGQVVTKGVPYQWAEVLDSNTANPLIAVDFGVFMPLVCEGDYFNEHAPKRLERKPRIIVADTFLKYQWACQNRRKLGRIDYVA